MAYPAAADGTTEEIDSAAGFPSACGKNNFDLSTTPRIFHVNWFRKGED